MMSGHTDAAQVTVTLQGHNFGFNNRGWSIRSVAPPSCLLFNARGAIHQFDSVKSFYYIERTGFSLVGHL